MAQSRAIICFTLLALAVACSADCVDRATRLQRGACAYRSRDTSDGDSIVSMDCPSLVEQSTNPWNPPTQACCKDLIDYTWNGCGCDGNLRNMAGSVGISQSTLAATARVAQIVCGRGSIWDPCQKNFGC